MRRSCRGWFATWLAGQCARFSKGQEPLLLVVPQVQARAAEAFRDCHAVAVGEDFVVSENLWQTVKRDTTVKVMDVVDADVGAEPLERCGQHVV